MGVSVATGGLRPGTDAPVGCRLVIDLLKAVVLGTLFNDEELSVNLLIALPIILVGVAMVTAASRTTAAADVAAAEPVPDA